MVSVICLDIFDELKDFIDAILEYKHSLIKVVLICSRESFEWFDVKISCELFGRDDAEASEIIKDERFKGYLTYRFKPRFQRIGTYGELVDTGDFYFWCKLNATFVFEGCSCYDIRKMLEKEYAELIRKNKIKISFVV